jgi:glycosyltransferase involved in cell wall biosynthesis
MSQNLPFLEVVMPAYMKGATIVESITRLRHVLDESSLDYAIHIVVDGPDVVTETELAPLIDSRIRMSVFPENMGKGSALRHGVSNSSAKFIAFLDADLDIHPESIVVGVKCLIESSEAALVCAYGSKFHPDSTVVYPRFRRVASSVYRFLVRILFRLDVQDSQTGLKVYQGDSIRQIVEHSVEQRFLFDLEVFSLLSKKGYNFTPIPVSLDYQYTSTIGAQAISRMFGETIRLAWRMRHVESNFVD